MKKIICALILIISAVTFLFNFNYIKNSINYSFQNINLEKKIDSFNYNTIELTEGKKNKIIKYLKNTNFKEIDDKYKTKCLIEEIYKISFDNYAIIFDEDECEAYFIQTNKLNEEIKSYRINISKKLKNYIINISK